MRVAITTAITLLQNDPMDRLKLNLQAAPFTAPDNPAWTAISLHATGTTCHVPKVPKTHIGHEQFGGGF